MYVCMIGVLICCCHKYYKDYEKCRERWKDICTIYPHIKFFYVFGTPGVTKYNSDTSVLELDTEDTYESLPRKIYNAIDYIVKNHPEITGIFKTDDDIEFDDYHDLFSELGSLLDTKIDYAGVYVDCCQKMPIHKLRLLKFGKINEKKTYFHDQAIYCYGAGYYISLFSAKCIQKNERFFYKRYLEDVAVGHILNKYDIFPMKMLSIYREIPRNKDK